MFCNRLVRSQVSKHKSLILKNQHRCIILPTSSSKSPKRLDSFSNNSTVIPSSQEKKPLSHSKNVFDSLATEFRSLNDKSLTKNIKLTEILQPKLHTAQSSTRRRAPRRRSPSKEDVAGKQEELLVEQQIRQMEKYASELKRQIKLKDEYELQQKKLKEEMEKHESKIKNENLPSVATAAPGEEGAVDTLMDFLDMPETHAQQELDIVLEKEPISNAKKSKTQSFQDLKRSLFALPAPSISLPEPILERMGPAVHAIASEHNQDWSKVVSHLYMSKEKFVGLSSDEVSVFIKQIPLNQRAPLLPVIHEMIWDAGIPLTKYIYDNTLAGYAEVGETSTIRSFIMQMEQDPNITVDHYTYAHLLKSLNKNSDLELSVITLKEMQDKKIQLTTPIYTTLLQTCIKVKDYDQAFQVFDMLKFMSTSTLPDTKVYNSVILAAAKQHNVNRVLDLYKEMTTRPIDPLQADQETYTLLIYACSRDKTTHLKAWHYLIEMYERGFPPSRSSLNSMLYLCGQTGEVSFARAIFRQMCSDPATYPDPFSFNSLLLAYTNFQPGFLSPILGTAVGPKLRASFFSNLDIFSSVPSEITPPFLPFVSLANKLQVLAESRAIYGFFKDLQWGTEEAHKRAREILNADNNSDKELNYINANTAFTYLKIPLALNNEPEFKFRWRTETCVSGEKSFLQEEFSSNSSSSKTKSSNKLENEQIVDDLENQTEQESNEKNNNIVKKEQQQHLLNRVPRTSFMYNAAIEAHTVHKWPYASAKQIWESRGNWRRDPTSLFNTQMTADQRKSSDFVFARNMVAYLAADKRVQEGLDLIRSTTQRFPWKKRHVLSLIDAANEMQDTSMVNKIKGVFHTGY